MKGFSQIIVTCAMVLLGATSVSAQEIFKEVTRIQKRFEAVKYDKTKKLDERRVASFQWDAIEYMLYRSKENESFTERQLGEQTEALMDFVKLYFRRLAESGKGKNKDVVVAKFRNASLNNSLFQDMDKDLVLAYVNNAAYATPFSLDTDWVKALAEVRSQRWN